MADRYYIVPGTDKYAPSVTTITSEVGGSGLERYFKEQAIRAAATDLAGWNGSGSDLSYLLGGAATPALEDFLSANMSGWLQRSDADRLVKAARGTLAHAALKAHLKGETVPPIEDAYAARAVNAGKLFIAECVDEIYLIEKEVHGRLLFGLDFAGTLDLLCRLRAGTAFYHLGKKVTLRQPALALVDWKSSTNEDVRHGLQLGGYSLTDEVRTHPDGTNAYLLNLYLDGDTAAYRVRSWDHLRVQQGFTGAAMVWLAMHPKGFRPRQAQYQEGHWVESYSQAK